MIGFAVIALVTYAVLKNSSAPYRFAAILVVLWTTAASYFFYYFGNYNQVVESIGYYQYQTIYPFVQILCLSMIRGKLSACLMVLYFGELTVMTTAFWFEGHGLYNETLYQSSIWLVFGVQMALMFSRTLTNGVHRALCRLNLARDPSAAIMANVDRVRSAKGSIGETKA